MKNLVLWHISDFAGTGFLRSTFPNELLNSIYGRKNLYSGTISNYLLEDQKLFLAAKAIHFQRQITAEQVRYMELFCRRTRDLNPNLLDYRIIYDLDDLYTEIPSYNNCNGFFNVEETIANLNRIKNCVDIFTVSTPYLRDKIKALGPGTCEYRVIRNCLPRYIYGSPLSVVQKPKHVKPRIVWAGSDTHFSSTDMGDFAPIYDLIKNTGDEFDWILLGVFNQPGWMKELKVQIEPSFPLLDYPNKLKGLNADFGVAPLLDNEFNRSKSNIKLLDYASADIIGICSVVLPYMTDAKVFFQADWQSNRDLIWTIFNDEILKSKIINDQRKMLRNFWLENNINIYLDLLGFKTIKAN